MTSIAVPLGVVRAGKRTRWIVTERPENERELVLAAQRGQREAFSALVRMHERRAYAVARAIVVNHEDAEDAVQDGFLHAYRALDRFLPDQAFGAWLHRIVANAALAPVVRREAQGSWPRAQRASRTDLSPSV